MEYEWYADVFFLTGFFMDAAGVFAAAVCCRRPVKLRTALPVCALSELCSVLLVIFTADLSVCRLIVHTVINPCMIALIFRPRRPGEFFRPLLTVYLVLFFAGGVQESVLFQAGISGNTELILSGFMALAAFLIYMRRQKVMRHVCTVDLWLGSERIRVNAFCDSGNLLTDPENGKPVSILHKEAVLRWCEKNPETRSVPYRTISGTTDCLNVITLDKMDIYTGMAQRRINAPEVGLLTEPVMRQPPVQMLLHSSYIG